MKTLAVGIIIAAVNGFKSEVGWQANLLFAFVMGFSRAAPPFYIFLAQ